MVKFAKYVLTSGRQQVTVFLFFGKNHCIIHNGYTCSSCTSRHYIILLPIFFIDNQMYIRRHIGRAVVSTFMGQLSCLRAEKVKELCGLEKSQT